MTTRQRSFSPTAGQAADLAKDLARKAGGSGDQDDTVTYAPGDEVLAAARRVAKQDAELLRRLAQ